MSKALIFSDLHIHDHKDRVERLKDCLDVLEWVFKVAEEKEVEYIFFLGDLFHDRSKIDIKTYMHTFECFMKHMDGDASDRQMFLLVGNHDMYHKDRWDINSVKPLSAIPRVSIIQNPTTMTFGGRKIQWLPHAENPIQELEDLKKSGPGDILFAHMAVDKALTNTFYGVRSDVIVEYDSEMVPVDAKVFEDWGMTMLGHYHGWQKLSEKAEYVGSPLQLSYGEAFQQKHCILLDLETMEKEYIKNTFSPQHLIITEQDITGEAYDFNHKFVRLQVDNIGKAELIDIQRKFLKDYKPLTFDFKQADKKVEEQNSTVVEDAKMVLMNIKEMIEKFVDDRGVPDGLTKKRLVSAGIKCLEKHISS